MAGEPDGYSAVRIRTQQAPRNGDQTTVRVPTVLAKLIQQAKHDVDADRSDLDVASVAVNWTFGELPDVIGYEMDAVRELRDISTDAWLDGETVRPVPLTEPLNDAKDHQVGVRLDPETMRGVRGFGELFEAGEGIVCRHLLAIAFRWYSEEVAEGDRWTRATRLCDRYVMNLRKTVDRRFEDGL